MVSVILFISCTTIFTSHAGTYISNFVSNYGPTLLSECQESLAKHNVPLASNQIAYSLIGRHNGAQETVDRCNELGIKVLAYYPFAMVRRCSFFN
jgi:diketogulonate reductase-like aldo/keto reductase